jgi:GGDEF domain-containing protein
VPLSASLGVAFHPAVAAVELLTVADEAMFTAKRQGGGRLQVAGVGG